ncbi:MAG: DUF998 domain-containing protein [Nakamurella sp.]
MTTRSTTTQTPMNSSAPTGPTRLLLTGGLLAGPVFVITGAVQAWTRSGFNLSHQPLSLLTLGELGWIQIANFVLAGLLSVCFAIGVGRRLTAGRGSVWAPRLLAVFGVGLIMGGVFVPDPALGYPVGTPDEIPSSLSWHGLLHAVAPPLAFLALVAACLVVARRLVVEGRPVAVWGTRILAVSCFLLAVPVGGATGWRLFIAVAAGFGWVAWFAADLLRLPAE